MICERHHLFKFWVIFVSIFDATILLQFFEVSEVEPVLFVVKSSNIFVRTMNLFAVYTVYLRYAIVVDKKESNDMSCKAIRTRV